MEETELCFPQLLNSSCVRQKRPQIEAVCIYTLLSSISLLTAVLNLLVIISIAHFKQLHTPTNLLLLSLAVSDFFVGLIMACQISLLDGCWFLGDHMCALYSSLDYIATSASVGTMVLISADRYVAICDPLHYPPKITIKRVSLLLFYFNSCLNPLIYTFCYPWFLKSIKLIVTFKIFRHCSSKASIL
ncbi:trace amine-associated receptor 9-like [Oreochromis aureus]|uniref:trace amine-associated receptor 9-like n=1 Tax=Oreochromis aureus TaxID=47969 RepID=UPI001953D757|nr:trace amine-associated receptor 9-like [Oreochromis aureus]CAI5670828.1 unnamed protein product [Mustela putorius furo]